MAKSTVKTYKRTREISIDAVMLHARAIIEQGRTDDFLTECAQKGYTMRGTAEFLNYAREFALASGDGPQILSTGEIDRFTKAVRTKNCDNVTRK
jgi:hypothetical protein